MGESRNESGRIDLRSWLMSILFLVAFVTCSFLYFCSVAKPSISLIFFNMLQAINLVCTRSTDREPALLERWYNDHAQLLMASPELQSAELFRFNSTTEGMDYFCLYHFSALERFAGFDSGEVMTKVRELSNTAPGRSSIEIVRRTQYERVLHRQWLAGQGGATQASLFTLESYSLSQATRWLNDVLYALHLQHPLRSAQVYATTTNKPELFVLLQAVGSEAFPVDWHTWESPYASRPNMRPIWQSKAERITQWLR